MSARRYRRRATAVRRARARRASDLACGALLLLANACGGAPGPGPQAPTPSQASAGPAAQPEDDGLAVSGLLGTIPSREIDRTLTNRLRAFQRCFFDGLGEVEFLGGGMEFLFRVGKDGMPLWVHPRATSVGHRATERCLLAHAAQTRFPRPEGGSEAEFAWGFELDPPDGVRPPVAWDADRIAPARAAIAAATADCGAGQVRVTAYVAPGGSVLAAGAGSEERVPAEVLDCVVEGVQGVTLPDPGSYAAKLGFVL